MKEYNRKSISVLLCLVMCAALLLGGCKKEPEEVFVPDEPEVSENTEAVEEIVNTPPAQVTEVEEPEHVDVEASEYTAPDSDSENVGFIVLAVSDDDSQATVTWYSKSANAGKLIVAKAAEMSGTTFPVTMLTGDSAPYTANYEDYFANSATVSGLEAGTKYSYMVGNSEGWSSIRSFWTAEDGTLDVIVTGDIQLGTGDDDTGNMEAWKRISKETAERFPDYNLHLNMGDVTYVPEDQYYPRVLDTEMFSNYPCGVLRGNHDQGAAFLQHFTRPNKSTEWGLKGGEEYANSWYRYGDVLFFDLNYQVDGIDIQLDHLYFMREVMEANPDAKWTVAMQHYSPFSSVDKYKTYGEENREDLMIAYETLGIDLVLAGHDHAYTRTGIVKEGQATAMDVSSVTNPDGTLYVTFSSASGSQYHDVNPYPVAAKCLQTNTPHVSTLNFTDNTMKLTVYDAESWEVLDTFEIVKE